MRTLCSLAAAVLAADLQGSLAARPAKADQHQRKEEEEKPVKVTERQIEDEEDEEENFQQVDMAQRHEEVVKANRAQKRVGELEARAPDDKPKKAGSPEVQDDVTPEEAVGSDDGQEAEIDSADKGEKGKKGALHRYHLTPDGAKTCDFGVTVTETECRGIGEAILADMKIKPGRDYLVSGSFKNAPPGCSVHTQMDWAITYNTNTDGDNNGEFAEICHGAKEEVHGVKEGENECDFGEPVKVDKCLDAINAAMHTVAGEHAKTQITLNVGHWNTLPPGCSMHVGAGSNVSHEGQASVAWFNTKKDATNDGSYVLVCTGTVVPMR